MGSAIKSLFGGSDDSAQRAQSRANEATQQYIEQQAAQARQDVLGMFPLQQQTRQQGFQQAIDVMGQATPEQARLYEQGNLAAQQQGFRGQTDYANAILGLGTGMTQYQPQSLQPNFSWMNQSLGPRQVPGDIMGGQVPPVSQPAQPTPAMMLAGGPTSGYGARTAGSPGGLYSPGPYADMLSNLFAAQQNVRGNQWR